MHKHPVILASFGAVIAIAAGSFVYYKQSSKRLDYPYATVALGAISEEVSKTGQVNPVENPDLSFEKGGRVTAVNTAVGAKVLAGKLLAAVDSSDLNAQLLQAQADLEFQKAKLDGLKSGPRDADVEVKNTQVAKAEQDLQNTYSGMPDALKDSFAKADDAVRNQTNSLFTNPDSANLQVVFTATDSQLQTNAQSGRLSLNQELASWSKELLNLGFDPASLEAELSKSQSYLGDSRSFLNRLVSALSTAIVTPSFPQSAIDGAKASISAGRASVGQAIASLNTIQQTIASEKLALKLAKDQLAQIKASSTPQDIEAQSAQADRAQAAVANIRAQIAKTTIVAPFSGTVSRVSIKQGQMAAPDVPVISLTSDKAFEVDVYASETDTAKMHVGNPVVMTLDAFGTGRTFSGKVASVDQSPTLTDNVQSYKVVIGFDDENPDIKAGMGANVIISVARKDNALVLPRSAVFKKGGKNVVLARTASGNTEKEVALGIDGGDKVEITSGLRAGDEVAVFGNK